MGAWVCVCVCVCVCVRAYEGVCEGVVRESVCLCPGGTQQPCA